MIDGQISMFAEPRLKLQEPVRLIELFAGIGAQAKAFENLGINFTHHFVCEIDKYAVKSYNAVHGTNVEPTDITQIHASDLNITETDKYQYFLTYSFPCTDLSTAGAQKGMAKGSGTRSGLLWEVERLLEEIDQSEEYDLPQILLMENVPQVCSDKNLKDFNEWLSFLRKIGYSSKYEILNSKDYGIPQNRKRCFMVSWLGYYSYEFPRPFDLKYCLNDFVEKSVDEKYFLSSKATEGLAKQLEMKHKPTIISTDADSTHTHTGRDSSNNNKDWSVEQVGNLPIINDRNGISHAIRCGGRGDIHAKHSWDLIADDTDS